MPSIIIRILWSMVKFFMQKYYDINFINFIIPGTVENEENFFLYMGFEGVEVFY